jgi:8-oxo-dGTP pyrophosphatase MutT (NUDIX family)
MDKNRNSEKVRWEDTVTWVGIVAGSIIRQSGKYLLVQEKKGKAYGKWNLPAGYVDKGESIEAAAVREAHEETGYKVELGPEIGLYHEGPSSTVKHIFRARIVGGDLRVQPEEILDAKWLSYDEIKQLHGDGQIRADWIFDVVGKVEAGSDQD